MHRTHDDPVTVITTALPSQADEFDKRRRKYAVMMASRAVCVVLAALTYQISIFIALGLVVAGAVLPWCAVLIANDRPPKRRRAQVGWTGASPERALPAGRDDRTVDG